MSDEAPRPPLVVPLEDLCALMRSMRENQVAFVELPGLLRLGLMPEPRPGASVPPKVSTSPAEEATAEEAIKRSQLARDAARKQAAEEKWRKEQRLNARRTGGIGESGPHSIAAAADALVEGMGPPPPLGD